MKYQTEEIFLLGKKVEKENKQLVEKLIRKKPKDLDGLCQLIHMQSVVMSPF